MYRFWNALYHLASAIELPEAAAAALLGDQNLRCDPAPLEAMAEGARGLVASVSEGRTREGGLERDLAALRSEIAHIRSRRGHAAFMRVSEALRRAKHHYLGLKPGR